VNKIKITYLRRVDMIRRSFSLMIPILSFGLIISGCPKKTVIKEEPSIRKAEESVAEQEKEARLEAARREREAKEKELAKIKEEEAKKAQEKKEFEKSLVAKKTPRIEGEILETKLLKDIHFDFDKYDIRPEDGLILQENAPLLLKHPAVKIRIEGHCDERGTVAYNLALGERRANSAKNISSPLELRATISRGSLMERSGRWIRVIRKKPGLKTEGITSSSRTNKKITYPQMLLIPGSGI
jgi:peptidoglycan-associated lipoprotein